MQPDYYKRRQSIVEHPYGTIKRQWGFHYIITKKYKHRAEADSGMMFIVYNLRRIINLMGLDVLKTYLENIGNLFKVILHIICLYIKLCKEPVYFTTKLITFKNRSLKRLIFSQNIGFSLVFRRTAVVRKHEKIHHLASTSYQPDWNSFCFTPPTDLKTLVQN